MKTNDIKGFITDDREKSWENIISRLRFIAAIKEGQKIDVKSLCLVDTGYMSRAWRTVFSRGENRDGGLLFIKETFGDALDICSHYVAHDDEFYRGLGKSISGNIQDSICGLRMFKKTYYDDPVFVGRIDALLILIGAKLEELRDSYPDLVILPSK